MDLGDRMKGYENCWRTYLPRRMPMIIRVDGRAFHTLTKGFEKPWDPQIWRAMAHAAIGLMQKVQGSKLAYSQSDEISILATDYDKLTSEPWFGKNIQKIVSVAASIAGREFNRLLRDETGKNFAATFDARVFVLPKEEVCNYFIWRQQDAVRNSIQGLGQSHFSHKYLHSKSCDEIQEMLFNEKGINWNDEDTWKKRGWCYSIERREHSSTTIPDTETPSFTQNRDYIEKHVYLPEEPV